MRGSHFIFDCVHLLYYKRHKINFKRGGSYIDSPDWVKAKKQQLTPSIKKDNKCSRYVLTVALNHGEIKKDPERIKTLRLLSINIIGKK